MENKELFLNAFLNACRVLAKYNTETNEINIVKSDYPPTVLCNLVIDAHLCLQKLIDAGVIYPEDQIQFEHVINSDMIRHFCEKGQNGTLLVYRRVVEDKIIWSRFNMFVPEDYSKENPYVVIFVRDMPEKEAELYEAWGLLGQQVHKVSKANLTTKEHEVIKEPISESSYRHTQPHKEYEEEMEYASRNFIYKDDVESFEKHMDANYICKFFKEGNSDYRFYYRRKIKGLYRWVCLNVIPTSEYEDGNEVFYFYISDVHRTILKMLDIQAATKYAYYYAKTDKYFSEGYYENLLEMLSVFTHPYVDYYLIDLQKDLYINYKISHNAVEQQIPYIGSYTAITSEYLLKNYEGEEREMLLSYSSSEKLRELLKNRMTIEYSFTYPTGEEVTTTIIKTESKYGIPTKVICSTLPKKKNDKLIIRTFGNFEVLHPDETPVYFSRKQSKQLFAYLIDRQGYPVTSKDIVIDILEKDPSDMKAIKYVSTLVRRAMKDLEDAGYPNVIVKEQKSIRVNKEMLECDYYHFIDGDVTYWKCYHNEYMKEYSWAEETNAELLNITNI